MKNQTRLDNLKQELQTIQNQLANIQHPNDVVALITARERLIGAISVMEAVIEQEKKKEK